ARAQLRRNAMRSALCLLVLSSILVCREAHADPTPGWIVLGSGLAVGGTLTGYGLSLDCHDDERSCHKRAGIFIWGGVGIGALASAIGLAAIESGRASTRRSAAAIALAVRMCGTGVSF